MIGRKAARFAACLALATPPSLTLAGPMPADKAAALFGAQPMVEQISLSPDGSKVAYISPMAGKANALLVAPTQGDAQLVVRADGAPFRISGCNWSASDRLVCRQYGLIEGIPFTRMTALDSNGGNQKTLGRRNTGEQMRMSQFDGSVIDWMSGSDGNVLMTRDFVPERTTGTLLASAKDGLGVERVDTRTLATVRVEQPRPAASGYIADGRGEVRLMIVEGKTDVGMLTGRTTYMYRDAGGKGSWKTLVENDAAGTGWQPIAVDGGLDKAYALHKLDGRYALYRISLDGNATKELVYANPTVDVDDVIQVGRSARVIGATYVTDRRETAFFDPAYAKLAKSLTKAVPGLPLISFIGASADENVLLLRAGSDVDAGRYYVLDRIRHDMKEILHERPGLDGETLAPVRSVSYRAADGTMVPAYLTLPVGGGKGLPAIVMPHGGPASRDEWGFDWLAQFYAARGYAVLQPNFRGSTGYGDQWFVDNGFRSWRAAIGDVTAAGHWLLSEGIAAPGKLAIVGWSYGGYAALQSAVVDPDLFKAVVAIAPVTDLAMLKREVEGFTNARVMQAYIGSGPHVTEGSPLRHAGAIKAPVLMFHGDRDINVAIGESREMDQALRAAGAKSELVTYKTLDHQLRDAAARTDMLTRSDAFLRAALKM